MIVGCKEVDWGRLKQASRSNSDLDSYVMSLIPKYLRHIPQIVNNQKYLVALYLRSMKSIPYTVRKERCEYLLQEVSICGVINTIVDFEDVLLEADVDTLVSYLLKEE